VLLAQVGARQVDGEFRGGDVRVAMIRRTTEEDSPARISLVQEVCRERCGPACHPPIAAR
jgi:hypothetical protein